MVCESWEILVFSKSRTSLLLVVPAISTNPPETRQEARKQSLVDILSKDCGNAKEVGSLY